MNKTSVKLKPNSKAMANFEIENPKETKTDAYLATHKTTNRATARAEASKLTAKPSYQIYKQEQVDQAKVNILDLANNAENESVKLKANQDVIDRNEGKATQKQITENTNLNINVEADQKLSKDFMAFMKAKTTQN